jgi:hypothetical protein
MAASLSATEIVDLMLRLNRAETELNYIKTLANRGSAAKKKRAKKGKPATPKKRAGKKATPKDGGVGKAKKAREPKTAKPKKAKKGDMALVATRALWQPI